MGNALTLTDEEIEKQLKDAGFPDEQITATKTLFKDEGFRNILTKCEGDNIKQISTEFQPAQVEESNSSPSVGILL